MRRALPLGILSLVAFLVWFVLLTGSDDVAAPNAAWRYWIPLTGLALGIVFWVLIRDRAGAAAFRLGQRVYRGVVWDSERRYGLVGLFQIRIKPYFEPLLEEDPPLGALKGTRVREFALSTDPPPVGIEFPAPEMWITLEHKGYVNCCDPEVGSLSGYSIASARFIGPLVHDGSDTSKSVSYSSILIGREMAYLHGWEGDGSIFAMLRRIGGALAQLGSRAVRVRLVVEWPETPDSAARMVQGSGNSGLAGLASDPTPGIAGGLVAATLGVAPVLGVIAAAALGGAGSSTYSVQRQIADWKLHRANMLVYGRLGRPGNESLKSVVEEFGWEIIPPSGCRFPGIGQVAQILN